MRIRSGFTGNVLGFGIQKRISASRPRSSATPRSRSVSTRTARRKFSLVRSRLARKLRARDRPLGQLHRRPHADAVLARRDRDHVPLRLPIRPWLPGPASGFGQSTAGSVGFGVLGNGFGAGFVVRDAEPWAGSRSPRGRLRRQRHPGTTCSTASDGPAPSARSLRAHLRRHRLGQAVRERRLAEAVRPRRIDSQLRRLRHGLRRRRSAGDRPGSGSASPATTGKGIGVDVFARAAPVRSISSADITSPGRAGPRLPQLQRGERLSLSARQDANGRRRLRPDAGRGARSSTSGPAPAITPRPPVARGQGAELENHRRPRQPRYEHSRSKYLRRLRHPPAADRHRRGHDVHVAPTTSTSRSNTSTRSSSGTSRSRPPPARPTRAGACERHQPGVTYDF